MGTADRREPIIKDVTSEESVYLTTWAWSFELGCGVEQDMEEVDYWCLRALSGEVHIQGRVCPSVPCYSLYVGLEPTNSSPVR